MIHLNIVDFVHLLSVFRCGILYSIKGGDTDGKEQ